MAWHRHTGILRRAGIKDYPLASFFLDLNPIETVWSWMKDYIKDKWGLEKPLCDKLCAHVKEALEAVQDDWLKELL